MYLNPSLILCYYADAIKKVTPIKSRITTTKLLAQAKKSNLIEWSYLGNHYASDQKDEKMPG